MTELKKELLEENILNAAKDFVKKAKGNKILALEAVNKLKSVSTKKHIWEAVAEQIEKLNTLTDGKTDK